MSNGMHHVAPASFFPTAKELSSGLQWFKEHPILAAAAATAVSVITYLNTAEDDEMQLTEAEQGAAGKDEQLLLVPDATHHNHHHHHHAVAATSTATTASATSHRRELSPPRGASPPTRRASAPTNTITTTSTGRVTPPALRKPGSEGKLSSPAAVSWVDEHGGSLTQVFEHLTTNDDDDDNDRPAAFPDLDGPLRANSSPTTVPRTTRGRPPTPPRHTVPRSADDSASSDAVSNGSHNVAHWMGALAQGGVQSPQPTTGTATATASSHAERPTESPSPQWGWYVPITPPQDHLSSSQSSGIPRAVAVPPSGRRSSTTTRAGVAASGPKSECEPLQTGGSVMRRSVSGRIKAA